MPSNDCHFVTTWHVPASREEISEVISDATGLARWWPSSSRTGRQRHGWSADRPNDERATGSG
jgi:uncharacterized protein YndB with AHSA1/START domain